MSYQPPDWVKPESKIGHKSITDHFTGYRLERLSPSGAWIDMPGQPQRGSKEGAESRREEHLRAFPGDQIRLVQVDEWKHWLVARTVQEPACVRESTEPQRRFVVTGTVDAETMPQALDKAQSGEIAISDVRPE